VSFPSVLIKSSEFFTGKRAHHDDKVSVEQIAQRPGIVKGTVYRWRERWNDRTRPSST
jgi:transposase-like protein